MEEIWVVSDSHVHSLLSCLKSWWKQEINFYVVHEPRFGGYLLATSKKCCYRISKFLPFKRSSAWLPIARTRNVFCFCLKDVYFGHLMGRANPLEKTLMLGKIEGRRRRGRQRTRWLDGITNSMNMSFTRRWWRTGKPGVQQPMELWRVGHDWATEQQQKVFWISLQVCARYIIGTQ